MKTFRIPLQIDSRGHFATTEDPATILEQRVIDLLVTYFGERVMRPEHGADLQGFLFSPIKEPLMGIKAEEIKNLLNDKVGIGSIEEVLMVPVEGADSSVRVQVYYRLITGGELLQVTKTVSGLVTEETAF